jgi:bifunctional DNA-binding transcriptional regulator/antitoxin component of YhaV-PrlF toxin-antitoxin module
VLESMVKITNAQNQYRVNIPKEILIQTGWDENTELNIFPYLKDPSDPITPDTPIIMKRISR